MITISFCGFCHFSSLFECFLQVSSHIESTFWVFITSSLKKWTKSFNGFWKFNEFSFLSWEDLTHKEWLWQETLDLSGSGHSQFIFFRQLVHTQDSNNILEWFVILEQFLYSSCCIIVSISHNGGVEHSWSWIQRIDGWINTQFSKSSVQHSGGIQMGECCGRSWIGQVISWHIDCLHRGNWSFSGCCNSFLQCSQIGSEGWLISDSRWNTS